MIYIPYAVPMRLMHIRMWLRLSIHIVRICGPCDVCMGECSSVRTRSRACHATTWTRSPRPRRRCAWRYACAPCDLSLSECGRARVDMRAPMRLMHIRMRAVAQRIVGLMTSGDTKFAIDAGMDLPGHEGD